MLAKNFSLIFTFIVIFQHHVMATQRFFRRCHHAVQECPNSNVSFYLYTRDMQDHPILLNMHEPRSLFEVNFIRNRPLVILIHGYTGHRDFAPNWQIRPAYFQKDEFNIVSVDYKYLAMEPCYNVAVANLPTVANCTAGLINYLVDTKIFPMKSIHVIGFSLGAQTAGMVANYITPGRKLRRITGLDPAKPMFIRADSDGRLDASDAEFVDVIHTDVFARGVLMPTGHLDFYANGGFDQPGCYHQLAMSPGSCNHERAPAYYAESINSEIGFWGFRCAHWYLYALGFCKEEDTDSIAEMGYNANRQSRGLYFLTTNSNPPHARGTNFTTNTVLPVEAEPDADDDLEIDGYVESTI